MDFVLDRSLSTPRLSAHMHYVATVLSGNFACYQISCKYGQLILPKFCIDIYLSRLLGVKMRGHKMAEI